ncbi:MAG: N-acetylmuramoyl-L-alanine amidase, partial [Chloroflexota bacterium]
PTQMPAVLAESLFLSNPTELRLLKRPAVRQAIAEAYYDAIAIYLASRATQVGYELIDGPDEATSGKVVEYRVEVSNQSNETMRGSRLRVGARPASFLYEGRGRSGRKVGQKRVPRLEPGQKVTVTVKVGAPGPGGDWVLLFDARDRDGKPASRLGSPAIQVSLRTVESPPAGSDGPPAVSRTPDA